MSTSIDDLKRWFADGVRQKATHMIVVCDTFDHEDYPSYVAKGEGFHDKFDRYNGRNMQRIMEVYDLSIPFVSTSARRWDVPKRPAVNGTAEQR